MASNIDASKPASVRAFTADVRANFAAAKSEIEALQTSDGVTFLQSGSGAVSRTVAAKLADHIHIKDYGGVVDSAAAGAANVTALNNAAADAVTLGVREIWFDEGLYYFASAPSAFTSGITLVGRGKRTTYLVKNYTESTATDAFLEWNGASVSADGGGLRNAIVYASGTNPGGAAIKLSGSSDSARAGHMSFVGVEVSSASGSEWNYCLYSDGSAITTAGSQGIRDVTFTDLTLFNADTKTMHVLNAVNWHFGGTACFQGSGATPDITVDGGGASDSNSQGVYFAGLNCGGNITLQNCNKVILTGALCSTLTVASTATNGAYQGVTTTQSVSSASFLVSQNKKTWTPVLTFTTAGDLAVVYSVQNGYYVRNGDLLTAFFNITTTTFTHTTASGNVNITGLPLTASSAVTLNYRGNVAVQGITKANYTDFTVHVGSGTSVAALHASGSAQNLATVQAADMPTGGTVVLQGVVQYIV